MVNKKFELKWSSPFCENEIVLTLSNVHEFVGALRAVLNDGSLVLLDISTYDYEH